MAQGTIKKYVSDRGFGFIAPQDGGKELFFHCKSLKGYAEGDIREGMRVSFKVRREERGPAAEEVEVEE